MMGFIIRCAQALAPSGGMHGCIPCCREQREVHRWPGSSLRRLRTNGCLLVVSLVVSSSCVCAAVPHAPVLADVLVVADGFWLRRSPRR